MSIVVVVVEGKRKRKWTLVAVVPQYYTCYTFSIYIECYQLKLNHFIVRPTHCVWIIEKETSDLCGSQTYTFKSTHNTRVYMLAKEFKRERE